MELRELIALIISCLLLTTLFYPSIEGENGEKGVYEGLLKNYERLERVVKSLLLNVNGKDREILQNALEEARKLVDEAHELADNAEYGKAAETVKKAIDVLREALKKIEPIEKIIIEREKEVELYSLEMRLRKYFRLLKRLNETFLKINISEDVKEEIQENLEEIEIMLKEAMELLSEGNKTAAACLVAEVDKLLIETLRLINKYSLEKIKLEKFIDGLEKVLEKEIRDTQYLDNETLTHIKSLIREKIAEMKKFLGEGKEKEAWITLQEILQIIGSIRAETGYRIRFEFFIREIEKIIENIKENRPEEAEKLSSLLEQLKKALEEEDYEKAEEIMREIIVFLKTAKIKPPWLISPIPKPPIQPQPPKEPGLED